MSATVAVVAKPSDSKSDVAKTKEESSKSKAVEFVFDGIPFFDNSIPMHYWWEFSNRDIAKAPNKCSHPLCKQNATQACHSRRCRNRWCSVHATHLHEVCFCGYFARCGWTRAPWGLPDMSQCEVCFVNRMAAPTSPYGYCRIAGCFKGSLAPGEVCPEHARQIKALEAAAVKCSNCPKQANGPNGLCVMCNKLPRRMTLR